MIRFLYSCIALALLFFAPWYVVYTVVLLGFVIFKNYAEGIIVAAFVDAVLANNSYTLVIAALAVLFVSYYVRAQIR
tara:strand:+ start:41 stop:271 length:231 start_codon:yes stop_codon:yes gene_type:complete